MLPRDATATAAPARAAANGTPTERRRVGRFMAPAGPPDSLWRWSVGRTRGGTGAAGSTGVETPLRRFLPPVCRPWVPACSGGGGFMVEKIIKRQNGARRTRSIIQDVMLTAQKRKHIDHCSIASPERRLNGWRHHPPSWCQSDRSNTVHVVTEHFTIKVRKCIERSPLFCVHPPARMTLLSSPASEPTKNTTTLLDFISRLLTNLLRNAHESTANVLHSSHNVA